jgi:hypothetical protein
VAQGLQAVVAQGEPQNSGRYVVRPQQPNSPSNRPHSAWLSEGVATSAATMPQQSVKPRAMREIIVRSPVEGKRQLQVFSKGAQFRYLAAAENCQAAKRSHASFGEKSRL